MPNFAQRMENETIRRLRNMGLNFDPYRIPDDDEDDDDDDDEDDTHPDLTPLIAY